MLKRCFPFRFLQKRKKPLCLEPLEKKHNCQIAVEYDDEKRIIALTVQGIENHFEKNKVMDEALETLCSQGSHQLSRQLIEEYGQIITDRTQGWNVINVHQLIEQCVAEGVIPEGFRFSRIEIDNTNYGKLKNFAIQCLNDGVDQQRRGKMIREDVLAWLIENDCPMIEQLLDAANNINRPAAGRR